MEEAKIANYLKWTGIALLVVFPFLFLGGIHIGPISVRMIVAYGLLGYALWRGKTEYLPTYNSGVFINHFFRSTATDITDLLT